MIRKLLLIALSLYISFTACTKISTTDIGAGLIPPIDGVNTKDTLIDIETATILEEDLTRIYKQDEHVIGVISNDPIFGKTTASAFFELKPPLFKFAFQGKKETYIVDSAVLILGYSGIYGDSTVPQTWRVFEINTSDTLQYDSAYATNSSIGFSNQLGIKNNFDLRSLNDSVNYGFEKAKNQVRIRLSNSFADRLIRQYDSTNAYLSNVEFRKRFAGFAVVPDQSNGNALVRVNLQDTNTKVALFYRYKNETADKMDTTVSYFRFILSSGSLTSGNANIITRDRSASEMGAHVGGTGNDSLLYIQTSPGSFARIKTPGLTTFPTSIIHRAELVVEQVPDEIRPGLDELMMPPRYVLLSAYDAEKKVKRNIPNDYILDLSSGANNIGAFGGFLSYKTDGATRFANYTFNITRYVQGIVSRKDPVYELRLSAPSNDSLLYTQPYPSLASTTYYISPGAANHTAFGRVRAGGGGGDKNRPHRMRLRIIYSKLQ